MNRSIIEKSLDRREYQDIMLNCLEAWSHLEQAERIIEKINIDGTKASALNISIQNTKDHIREIYTKLFLIDEG